jgi:hypothetical protein
LIKEVNADNSVAVDIKYEHILTQLNKALVKRPNKHQTTECLIICMQ